MKKDSFKAAWDWIWEKLYSSETDLFYDYLSAEGEFMKNLPTPEEIRLCIPNPCGWGTGMEDSVLNGTVMLDTCLALYRKEQLPVYAEQAHRIFAGLRKCAETGIDDGFLARSISPLDGKSYYIESSRDQYTHWVFFAWRYSQSPVCTEEERGFIRRFLAAIAERAHKNVVPETKYNLLRKDGGHAIVSQMRGPELGCHETMRLPMFYLAAWAATGTARYREWYEEVLGEALEKNQAISFEQEWLAYALLQMQCSLRLIWDLEDDPDRRTAVLKIMQRTTEYAAKYVAGGLKAARDGELRKNYINPRWRDRPMRYIMEGPVSGYAVMVPYFDPGFLNHSFLPVRDSSEGIMIQGLCPEWSFDPEQFRALQKIADSIDFSIHRSYAPILLTNAWYCYAN